MVLPILPKNHHLFQANRHVQSSIMLLSIMDGADLDRNNTVISSSTKTTSTQLPTSITTSDDYEKDLQLAAELGRCLLEQNQELQNYINVLQKQIDDEQCDIKLLHVKLESTREHLDAKCKQTEMLDATNIDLERELVQQRRDNERNRERIKELSDLCEKTRKQCQDIQQEYENFRSKQMTTHFFPKQKTNLCSTKLRRSNSLNNNLKINSTSPCSIKLDFSSSLIFKNHFIDLKSRIHCLTSECSTLNEKLHQSEQEKHYLYERLTNLERQHRDDNDSLVNELNHCKKLLEKYTNNKNLNSNKIPSSLYSPPEHDLSLYDEVSLENKPSYQPTNYKDLFARVYDKLKINNNSND